uniref:Uncharacterized protein n=1 Tax=Romanomermis culicivorax TaxID=13658 RepID=A0A915HG41_ROMCU
MPIHNWMRYCTPSPSRTIRRRGFDTKYTRTFQVRSNITAWKKFIEWLTQDPGNKYFIKS